mgnify:CR=1 FL=1
MKHLVAPSILSADFAHLGRDIEMINTSVADWIHVDVMDGRFVPNISFAFPVLAAIRPLAQKPLDVHLMIVEPDQYVARFAAAGAHTLSVHYEACPNLHRTLQSIKEAGMQAGVAINPHTPVHALTEVIEMVDVVIVMSVNPGYGGQRFIERTFEKVVALRQLIDTTDSTALIEIDGGVTLENADRLVDLGADILVAGSTVFKADQPQTVIESLKSAGSHTKAGA